jgi:uncharacterized membrane protein YfcA
MNVYLPIAEISVNVFALIGMGALVGMFSGLFGVGGGFLMTPLLIFFGIPPAVAVATQANQIVAISVSGALAHWRRGNVDIVMGLMLVAGGFVGSTGGVWLFSYLREIGQIDLVISLSFVVFLGVIGMLMLIESVRAYMKRRRHAPLQKRRHYWIHSLPLKMKFRKSGIYVSALLPIAIGAFIGLLVAIMGIGGGFIMVPAMIYLLGMPTIMVVGTSLFQIIFVTANVTFLQAATNNTVDILLAFVLMLGGIVGAQFGVRFGNRLNAESLRFLLSALVLGVCAKLLYDLVATPAQLYTVVTSGG